MFCFILLKVYNLNPTFSHQDEEERYRCKYQKKERNLLDNGARNKDKSIYANCLAKPLPGGSHLIVIGRNLVELCSHS